MVGLLFRVVFIVCRRCGRLVEFEGNSNGSSSGDCVGSAKAAPYADHLLMKTNALPTRNQRCPFDRADHECLRPSPVHLRAIVIGISRTFYQLARFMFLVLVLAPFFLFSSSS